MAKTTEEKLIEKFSEEEGYCVPMPGESDREFRMRACLEILESEDCMSFDDVVAEFNIRYAPLYKIRKRATFRTTKESITRAIKILEQRDLVSCEKGADGRRRMWYLMEEV